MSPKQIFLSELQRDRDYQEHKKNCITDNFSSYHPANVNNDTYILHDFYYDMMMEIDEEMSIRNENEG